MHSKKLLSILKPLAPSIDAKPVLPVCECVLIKGSRVYATNTQLSISNECDLPDMLLPYKQTMQILSVLNEEIEIHETSNQYIIKANSKKFPLTKFGDVDLFPDTPICLNEYNQLSGNDIEALKEASKNVSSDENSPWKNLFISDKWIVGNDNFAMYKYDFKSDLPAIAVSKLFARSLGSLTTGSISATGKHLFFTSGGLEISLLLSDSKQPNFSGVFPEIKTNFCVERIAFEVAIKQAALNPGFLKLSIANDNCNVECNGNSIDIECKNDINININFNSTIFQRILSSLPDSCRELQFMFSDPNKAAYVIYNNITLLIMPTSL